MKIAKPVSSQSEDIEEPYHHHQDVSCQTALGAHISPTDHATGVVIVLIDDNTSSHLSDHPESLDSVYF